MSDAPQRTGSAEVHSELSRDLTLFHITMMGLGMMIGAGVFVGMGICLGLVGPGGLVLTFALNGLIALFTAMSFAELSSAIPRAGGAYNFARVAFGRGTSFLGGWMEWLASSLAGSFYAVIFASFTVDYLNQLLGLGLDDTALKITIRATAAGAAVLFVYINYRGSSETGKLGAIFTVAQMLFVVAIGVVGIVTYFVEPSRLSNFTPFMPNGWLKMLASMGIIYVAFEGFEVIAQAGDETIEPRKNVPKAMLYSVAIVTVTYVLVAFGTVVAVRAGDPATGGEAPWEYIGSFAEREHGSAVAEVKGFKVAVQHLMGSGLGGLLVTLAVIFSSTSALNATVYSATRASYALGRDRLLPGRFAKISASRRTPYVALFATGAIVLAMSVWMKPKDLSATASIMFLLLFFLVNLCVIKVRRNMGDELTYGYLMPWFPIFPILAIVLQGALCGGILSESYVAWIIAGAWVAAGTGIYWLYSRHHAPAGEHDIQVLEQKGALPQEGYRVMVAVANPESVLGLVRNTYKLCGAKYAEVDLLHMVPVPSQVPLADARKYMHEGKEAITEAMLYLGSDFPFRSHLRYCRSISRGIVSACREAHADMLIMGWHGRRPGSMFRLGSTLDPVIERAPCDVVVLKDCGGNEPLRRVLVPLAGGPNGALALEVASILADPTEGEIIAFTVDRPGDAGRPFDLEGFVRSQADRIRIPSQRVHTKRVQGANVVQAILDEAEGEGGYDLVVLGSTRDSWLRKMTHVPVPETVARRCTKPLAMVNASAGLGSLIRKYV